MLRKRLALLTLSALMMGGTATAVPVVVGGSSVAGASSGTHKAGSFSDDGIVFEGKARIRYECSGNSGAYTLKITNLNVVDSTGHSYVDGDTDLAVNVQSNTTRDFGIAFIAQNTVDGLWGTTAAGTIPVGACQSGAVVSILDPTSGTGIAFQATLS